MILGPQLPHLLLIAQEVFSLPLASMTSFLIPFADQTGINGAMLGIARLLAGFLGGTLAVVLAVEGYQYMFSDSASRGLHLKRMFAAILGGAILVLLAATIAPQITTAILSQ